MSYLKFDKNLMINLEQSLPKEICSAQTNRGHITVPQLSDVTHANSTGCS